MISTTELKALETQARQEDLEALARGVTPTIFKWGHALPTSPGAAMTFVASESTTDRLGDTIEASGWVLEAYRQNPVFMWAHDHTVPPLGTAKVWVENRQLLANVSWDTEDSFAMQIKDKYARGFLKAVSVGFKPLEYEQNKTGGIRFIRQELLEVSAVPIPAHPNALKKALAGGFISLYPLPPAPLATLRGRIVELTGKAQFLGGEIGRKLTYQLEQALKELGRETPSGDREALRRVDLAMSLLKENKLAELKALQETLQGWKRQLEAEPSYWESRMLFRERALADGEIA